MSPSLYSSILVLPLLLKSTKFIPFLGLSRIHSIRLVRFDHTLHKAWPPCHHFKCNFKDIKMWIPCFIYPSNSCDLFPCSINSTVMMILIIILTYLLISTVFHHPLMEISNFLFLYLDLPVTTITQDS